MKNNQVLRNTLTEKVEKWLTSNGIAFGRVTVSISNFGNEDGMAIIHIRSTHRCEMELGVDFDNGEFRRTLNHSSASTGNSVEEAVEVLETFYKVAQISTIFFELLENTLKECCEKKD